MTDIRPVEFELDDGTTVSAAADTNRLYEIPEGMFKYSVRHTDEDDSVPATIEYSVAVNFMMDIILDKPIPRVELDGLVKVVDWGYLNES